MDVSNMAAIASFLLKTPRIIHKQLIAKNIYEKV